MTDCENPVRQTKNATDKRIMSVLRALFVLSSERIAPINVTIIVKCIPLIARIWLMPRREKSLFTLSPRFCLFPSKSAEITGYVSELRFFASRLSSFLFIPLNNF